MPIGGWVVEAVIRYSGNGVAFMERQAAATNATRIREAELRGEITAQEAAWMRLQARIKETHSQRMAMFSAGAGAVAVGGAAILGFSIDQAANMERSMLSLQIATHASKKTMDAFKESIYQTAFATAQSAPDIAAIYGAIASTSGLPASSLTPKFMSMVTKFGEVVQMKSVGTSHEYTAQEAAKQAIELAHQFRAYTPEQIGPFLEMLHKATYFLPEGLSQFLTQSKYYTPAMALSGGNLDAMQQSILLGTLLQQTGIGRGRGGTSVATFERNIIQGLEPTKFMTKGRRGALLAMGLIDKDGNTPFVKTNAQNQSYFDVIGALAQVQKYAESKTDGLTGTARSHAEERILRDMFSALGIQGSMIGLVAAGGGLQQMRNVEKREKQIPSIAEVQAKLLQTFWGALQRDERGLQSLAAALGSPALQEITPRLQAFADKLRSVTIELARDPHKASATFNAIALVSGIAAIGAAARVARPAVAFVVDGLKDIVKTGGKAASVLDDVFLRGVGKEMVGAIDGLGKAARVTVPFLDELSGAIGWLLKGIVRGSNLVGDIVYGLGKAGGPGPDYKPKFGWGGSWWNAGDPKPSNYLQAPVGQQIRDGRTSRQHVQVRIDQLHVNVPPGAPPHETVNDLLTNPRSILYQGGPTYRTHPNIPAATTVPTQ